MIFLQATGDVYNPTAGDLVLMLTAGTVFFIWIAGQVAQIW